VCETAGAIVCMFCSIEVTGGGSVSCEHEHAAAGAVAPVSRLGQGRPARRDLKKPFARIIQELGQELVMPVSQLTNRRPGSI
jgi:hypothetical protein